MKKTLFNFLLLFSPFFCFSQIVEVEFNEFLSFNSGTKTEYKDIINIDNIISKEFSNSGVHKYVFDFTNMVVLYYHNNKLICSDKIINYKKNGDLLNISINDIESLTGKKIVSSIVVNNNKNNSLPKFTLFFTSTIDGTTNGVHSL